MSSASKIGGSKSVKKSLLSQILLSIVGFLFCVGMPALVTGVVPASTIKFERVGDRVTATTQTCIFYIIPYRTIHIDPVTGIDYDFISGGVTRERRSGQTDKYTQAEDKGVLVIQGPDQSASILVSPFNLESVRTKAKAFLNDAQARELKLFVMANWKFGLIFGGLATFLTLIYIGSFIFAFGQMLFGKKKSRLPDRV